jgi:hypothetical protein
VRYPNGYVYEGFEIDGKFHGKGRYTTPTGESVECEFKAGNPWNGEFFFISLKTIGKGAYREGMRIGEFRYMYDNGCTVSEEYDSKGQKVRSVGTLADGTEYICDYVGGRCNNGYFLFVEHTPDGSIVHATPYVGGERHGNAVTYDGRDDCVKYFKYCRDHEGGRHGPVEIQYRNGIVITGQFQNDVRHGQWQLDIPESLAKKLPRRLHSLTITAKYADGVMLAPYGFLVHRHCILIGKIDAKRSKSNTKIIWGTQLRPDRSMYIGELLYDNTEHGMGKLYDPDGGRMGFEGSFDKGRVDTGVGVVVYRKGQKHFRYTGTYLRRKREGYGRMEHRDGTVYEGYFSRGARKGYGRVSDKDGFILHQGTWNDNELVSEEFEEPEYSFEKMVEQSGENLGIFDKLRERWDSIDFVSKSRFKNLESAS